MSTRAALLVIALLSLSRGVPATEPPPIPTETGPQKPGEEPLPPAPVLSGSSATAAQTPARQELVIFSGTLLLNEFIYRAILKLPEDAKATPQTAKTVAVLLAAFLREAGYDLAKVRAQVKGEQIEVTVDEGALDKVLFIGAGWITALRFRAALNLPLDVFNRRLFEVQMPRLARQFGLRGYKYELWPVHVIDTDNAVQLDDVEELRAMPLIRPARGYELRIFAINEPWSTGFSPEVILNGAIGLGLGGRYRWRDLIQAGDRWQTHFRLGGQMRSSLDPDGGTRFVNSNDYFTGRWLSRPWDGSSHGLRMTIAPRVELWSLQRRDLGIENYRIGTLELGSGAGANLTAGFSLFFTLGMQRRWIFDVVSTKTIPLGDDVGRAPAVENRGFLRLTSQYTFNPTELRQDVRNSVSLELQAARPTTGHDDGFLRFDLQGRRLFSFGWHELRFGVHVTAELGDISFVDEIPIADHLRIGFGLEKYTHRASSFSVELRYSLLRDKLKIGAFNDFGVWRHLPRDDPQQTPEVAGSTGGGIFLFLFDELQIDAFYGVGWSMGSSVRTGIALAIKEAF